MSEPFVAIPTGDYLLEIFKDGNVFRHGPYQQYEIAFNIFRSLIPIYGNCTWRIIKCMHNSHDQIYDRWDVV